MRIREKILISLSTAIRIISKVNKVYVMFNVDSFISHSECLYVQVVNTRICAAIVPVFVLLVCVKFYSAERYSNLPDEGVIINAIGVTIIAILAVVMYIVSRNKFRAESRDVRTSVDL